MDENENETKYADVPVLTEEMVDAAFGAAWDGGPAGQAFVSLAAAAEFATEVAKEERPRSKVSYWLSRGVRVMSRPRWATKKPYVTKVEKKAKRRQKQASRKANR